MSIYEIPEIVKYALLTTATPINEMNSSRKACIWPYDPNVFTEHDSSPSYITDRPLASTNDFNTSTGATTTNNNNMEEV